MPTTDPTDSDKTPPGELPQAGNAGDVAGAKPISQAPEFVTLGKRHWVLADLLRLVLIFSTLAVAGALTLILLPQSAVDGMVRTLQARHSASSPEQIAFLYLGDETADNQLHIRGVVRNITAVPIEQLDAIVRLYAHDRSLLETTVVRMSKETINPGEIAQFELVYPDSGGEFGSYSVEFKLRQGPVVPYKDMRTAAGGAR